MKKEEAEEETEKVTISLAWRPEGSTKCLFYKKRWMGLFYSIKGRKNALQYALKIKPDLFLSILIQFKP